ncbi:tautomerase family protein [Klebsiella pneumoniae]|nr:tautomerase family protein [Klebsiella variicola]HDU5031715.1 tautomerase family protein [Klebsiella variicola]
MPLIYVNAPQNTFTDDQRDCLAEELTTIALDSEHLPSTPFVRSTTWIYFNEIPAARVYNGGKSEGTKIIALEVNAFEGGLNDQDKKSLIKRFTDAIKKYSVHSDKGDATPVYIILRDVKDTNWGVFGDRITLDDLRNPPVDATPV